MSYTYNATITFDGNYYYADFEDFNGQVFTHAKSREELYERMKDVLKAMLELYSEDNKQFPKAPANGYAVTVTL